VTEIAVAEGAQDGERLSFEVKVSVSAGESVHQVTVARAELERLAQPGESGSQFIHRCFEFLLEREPKESIMRSFDVSVIRTYFPDFDREIGS
jgi:hypothetical protein